MLITHELNNLYFNIFSIKLLWIAPNYKLIELHIYKLTRLIKLIVY